LVEAAVENDGDVDFADHVAATVDPGGYRVLDSRTRRPARRGGRRPTGADIPDSIRPAQVFDRVWWCTADRKGLNCTCAAPAARGDFTLAAVAHRLELAHTNPPSSSFRASRRVSLSTFRAEDAMEVARVHLRSLRLHYPNPDLFYPIVSLR